MNRRAQVIALHGQGLSQRAIGRQLNISQVAVRKHLLRAGLHTPRPQRPPVVLTPPLPVLAPQPQPEPSYSLDVALLAALQNGACFCIRGTTLVLDQSVTLAPPLQVLLEQREEKILRLTERTRADRFPCGRCGNRLLLHTSTGVICPTCHPDKGIEWIWAER